MDLSGFVSILLASCVCCKSLKPNWSGEECSSDSFRWLVKKCASKGEIVNRQKFECHQVNSQGGCREDERLVMDRNSDCKAGVCVENRADNGQACRDQVVYSGECWEQESEEPCSRQPGTRLAPDLFGGVECKCAFHLGHTLQEGVCQKWGPSLLDIRGLNFLEKEIWRRCVEWKYSYWRYQREGRFLWAEPATRDCLGRFIISCEFILKASLTHYYRYL